MTLTELNEIRQNYKVLELAVDFINSSYNISRAKHLDTARYIICTLTENGIPRTVKANEVARIRLQKPDRTYVYNDCDILQDGRVFITLTEQILAVEGNAVCDIQLTDEQTGIIYSTKNFIINIDKTAVNNSVMESTNEFGALNSLIANNKKLNDELNANEKARQVNEEQRINNENERQTNETDRQDAEDKRVNAENIRISNENQRIENENTRKTNEDIRQTQEADRENNTATAISNAEKAVKKANDAANDLQSKLDSHHFVLTEDKGIANGVAELDSNGFIPSSQLPSYVDDVIEGYFYNNKFYREAEYITEIIGETGKIYVDLVSNKTYRWSGSAFAIISETIALGETSSTAYRGDRGKSAYDHSQTLHAPANAEENQNTFSNVNVGSTTISANSKTDTLTFAAGDNITITPDAENNKITISSTGGNGDSNHTHNYAGSDTPGGIAFEASSAYNLNISKTNEINFVKPNWTEPHTVHFGYKWADGTSENLISSYYFDNGNKELAPVVASRFIGTADNANKLSGYGCSTGTDNNTIVRRNEHGYIFGSRFNQNSPNDEDLNISQVLVTNGVDNYFRKTNIPNLKTWLNSRSCHNVSVNNDTGAKYVKIATINVLNTYINTPIKFKISQRARNSTVDLFVTFVNANNTDPDINTFYYTNCIGSDISYYTYYIYIVKSATSTWDIYVRTFVTYDYINIIDFIIPEYLFNRISIDFKKDIVDSLPSGYIQANYRSYASGLSTARNIKIGNETHSFDGTSNITFTAENMNLAPQGHASTGTGYGVGTTTNYGHCKTINDLTHSSYLNGEALSAYQGNLLQLNKYHYRVVQSGQTVTVTGIAVDTSYSQSYYFRFRDNILFSGYCTYGYGSTSMMCKICGANGTSSTVGSSLYLSMIISNSYLTNSSFTFKSATFNSSKGELTLAFVVPSSMTGYAVIQYTPNLTTVSVT